MEVSADHGLALKQQELSNALAVSWADLWLAHISVLDVRVWVGCG
jgi:phage tail protein X